MKFIIIDKVEYDNTDTTKIEENDNGTITYYKLEAQ